MKIKETRKMSFEDNSNRLDKALAEHFVDLNRSQIKKLFQNNLVTIDGKAVKPKITPKLGTEIVIQIPEIQPLNVTSEPMNLDIIFEDNDVIVVNKPQGMVVHPSAGHPNGTLVNGLISHLDAELIRQDEVIRPGIVHRIDKDTSGLLMVAKNKLAEQSLSEQLKDQKNHREYLAIVRGNFDNVSSRGVINAPIGRDENDRMKYAVTLNGKPSVTHFEVVKSWKNYTLVRCILETGRTHQIRVHMKYIGHPIVGDPLYGTNKDKGDGQYLHAKTLGFVHPKTQEQKLFSVDPPARFINMINELDLDPELK